MPRVVIKLLNVDQAEENDEAQAGEIYAEETGTAQRVMYKPRAGGEPLEIGPGGDAGDADVASNSEFQALREVVLPDGYSSLDTVDSDYAASAGEIVVVDSSSEVEVYLPDAAADDDLIRVIRAGSGNVVVKRNSTSGTTLNTISGSSASQSYVYTRDSSQSNGWTWAAHTGFTSDDLANNSVGSAQIEDGAVGTSELAGNAVTNAKISSMDASKLTGTINVGRIPSSIARIASPAFTGNPTAPTQSASNDSTRLATTAFVKRAIDNLVGGAPSALDTLNELAEALNDDDSYATTITNQLALKANIASPALTGTPTVPDITDLNASNTTVPNTKWVTNVLDTLYARSRLPVVRNLGSAVTASALAPKFVGMANFNINENTLPFGEVIIEDAVEDHPPLLALENIAAGTLTSTAYVYEKGYLERVRLLPVSNAEQILGREPIYLDWDSGDSVWKFNRDPSSKYPVPVGIALFEHKDSEYGGLGPNGAGSGVYDIQLDLSKWWLNHAVAVATALGRVGVHRNQTGAAISASHTNPKFVSISQLFRGRVDSAWIEAPAQHEVPYLVVDDIPEDLMNTWATVYEKGFFKALRLFPASNEDPYANDSSDSAFFYLDWDSANSTWKFAKDPPDNYPCPVGTILSEDTNTAYGGTGTGGTGSGVYEVILDLTTWWMNAPLLSVSAQYDTVSAEKASITLQESSIEIEPDSTEYILTTNLNVALSDSTVAIRGYVSIGGDGLFSTMAVVWREGTSGDWTVLTEEPQQRSLLDRAIEHFGFTTSTSSLSGSSFYFKPNVNGTIQVAIRVVSESGTSTHRIEVEEYYESSTINGTHLEVREILDQSD